MPNTGQYSRNCYSCRQRRCKVGRIAICEYIAPTDKMSNSVILHVRRVVNVFGQGYLAQAIETTLACVSV